LRNPAPKTGVNDPLVLLAEAKISKRLLVLVVKGERVRTAKRGYGGASFSPWGVGEPLRSGQKWM